MIPRKTNSSATAGTTARKKSNKTIEPFWKYSIIFMTFVFPLNLSSHWLPSLNDVHGLSAKAYMDVEMIVVG